MNQIKTTIRDYLNSLPVELSPLSKVGTRYLKYCSSIDTDRSVHIAHRPWLNYLNYALTFFPPVKKSWIRNFRAKRIPDPYQKVLLATNGVFAFGLSLFGLAPSMQKQPPTLDRSRLQCLDLSLANSDWLKEFDVDQTLFYFGGREYSYSENIGYFISSSRIQAFRTTGELLHEWRSFPAFLSSELQVAEQIAQKQSQNDWFE